MFAKYAVPGTKASCPLPDSVLKKVSPGARLLAFYVDGKNDELVADAVKFRIDPVCRGEEVQ